MSTVTQQAGPALPAGSARPLSERRPLGDRTFQIVALASGLLVLVILILIAVSTTQQASSWFTTEGWGIFGKTWNPASNQFGALAFIYGTVQQPWIALFECAVFVLGLLGLLDLLLTKTPLPTGISLAVPAVILVDANAAGCGCTCACSAGSGMERCGTGIVNGASALNVTSCPGAGTTMPSCLRAIESIR